MSNEEILIFRCRIFLRTINRSVDEKFRPMASARTGFVWCWAGGPSLAGGSCSPFVRVKIYNPVAPARRNVESFTIVLHQPDEIKCGQTPEVYLCPRLYHIFRVVSEKCLHLRQPECWSFWKQPWWCLLNLGRFPPSSHENWCMQVRKYLISTNFLLLNIRRHDSWQFLIAWNSHNQQIEIDRIF